MSNFNRNLSKFSTIWKFKSALAVALLVFAAHPPSSFAQTPPPLSPAQPIEPAPPAPETDTPSVVPTLPPKPDFVPPDLVPVVEKMDIFFNILAKEGSAKAYSELLKGSGLLSQTAVVTDVVTNTDAAFKAFGNIEGFERIDLRRTGERLVSITYIGSCPRWPIRWNFVCYFGGGRWQILDIDISNDLDLMIDRGRKRLKDIAPQ